MNIVIVGASSRIAEYCARQWNQQAAHMVLCGRSTDKLALLAQDLAIRAPANRFDCVHFDAEDAAGIGVMLGAVRQLMTDIDYVLIAHGSLIAQQNSEASLEVARQSLQVNGVSVVLAAEAFAGVLEQQKHGLLAVIGSVAGDRGRQSNYVYGAAKGLIERYCEGLRNRLYRSGVQVTLIKPGPTDTPMTAEMKANGGRLADPQQVASEIVKAMQKKKAVIYAPAKWRLIMFIIRAIPEALFVRTRL